jgi:hypothetical protein
LKSYEGGLHIKTKSTTERSEYNSNNGTQAPVMELQKFYIGIAVE